MSGMGVPSTPVSGKKNVRANVHERLLAAAEEVFGKRGFTGASISEITRKTGIAQGSFYLHFPSKEEIFRELIRVRGSQLRDAIDRSIVGARDRAEIERAGFHAFFEWIAEHPWLYRATRQAEFIDPSLREDWYRTFAGGYAAALERAMDAGTIPRADPEVLACAVMGAADFTAMRWLVWDPDGAMPRDKIEAFIEIAHRAIGLSATSEPRTLG